MSEGLPLVSEYTIPLAVSGQLSFICAAKYGIRANMAQVAYAESDPVITR